MRLCCRVVTVIGTALVVNGRVEEGTSTLAVTEVRYSRMIASWWRRLVEKRECSKVGLYLYHTRKAAGTTLRLVLKEKRKKFWETEGLSIDARFLALRSVITIISVRDPVARAISMYWYEHVGWWDGIQHDHTKLRSLSNWISEWKDESAWKQDFARKNPGNVYIEIQNYMTKMLSAWNNKGQAEILNEQSLDLALNALNRFDFIFICERSRFSNHTNLLAFTLNLEPRRLISILNSDTLKADHSVKRRLRPKLAPDLQEATETLKNLNDLDLRLYDAAIAIDHARTAFFLDHHHHHQEADSQASLLNRKNHYSDPSASAAVKNYSHCEPPPTRQLNAKDGIFRPPGHKH